MKTCPNCGFESDEQNTECPKCGIIFKKWEKFHSRTMKQNGEGRLEKEKAEKEKKEEAKSEKAALNHQMTKRGRQDRNQEFETDDIREPKALVFSRFLSKRFVMILGGIVFLIVAALIYYQYLRVDFKKFQESYKILKTIQSETSLGVNYKRFSQLLKNLKTEILILKDMKLTDNERDILNNYIDAFNIYEDSSVLWKARNEYQLRISDHNSGIPSYCIPAKSVPSFIRKYNLPTEAITVESSTSDNVYEIEMLKGGFIQTLWLLADSKFKNSKYP